MGVEGSDLRDERGRIMGRMAIFLDSKNVLHENLRPSVREARGINKCAIDA